MNSEKILFIIAALNEEKNIAPVIKETLRLFPGSSVLVIDGYSRDKTVNVSIESGAHVIQVAKFFGIGGAVEAGLQYAYEKDFDVIIRIDADGQHAPSEVQKLYEKFKSATCDLMIGSRFLGKSDYETNFIRSFAIGTIALLMKLCYGMKISDCTSGCHIYSKRLFTFFAQDMNFNYSEVLAICLAHKAGFKVIEEFINMQERQTGVSTFTFKNAFFYVFRNVVDVIFTMPIRSRRKAV